MKKMKTRIAALLGALALTAWGIGMAGCSHGSSGGGYRVEDEEDNSSSLYRLNATEGCDFADGVITDFGSGDSTDASGGVFLYYPVAIDLANDTAELTATVRVNDTDGRVGLGVIDVYGGKVDSHVVATAAQKVRYQTDASGNGSGWSSTTLTGDACVVGTTYIWKVSVSGGKIKFEIYDSTGATVLATKDNSYGSWVATNGKNYLAIGAAGGSTANLTWSNIKVKVNGGTEYTINKIEDIPDKSTLSVAKTSAEVDEEKIIEIGYTALDRNGAPAEILVSSSKEEFAKVTAADGKIKITGVAAGTATITVINKENTDLKATIAVTVNGFNKTDGYDLVGVYPANKATAAYEDGEFMLTFDDEPRLTAGYSIKIYNEDGTEADSIAFADETMTLFGTELGVEDQLVRVEGNSVYFTPHIGKIANGKTYYVAIPNGAITGTMSGSTFTGLTNSKENTKWKFTTRAKKAASATITVDGAQNSTADFRTIQGALNAIGSSSGSYKITVAKGVYRELLYFKGSASVEIEGQGSAKYGKDVEVRYANAGSLNDSKNDDEKWRCLFEFIGGDLILENIYFNNTFLRDNTKGGALGGKKFTVNTQGEALGFDSGSGKRVAAYNCGFYGHQDTIRTIQKAWFYGCYIAGDVDFIWQEKNGLVQLVEKCEIVVLGDDTKTAYIVAPGAEPSEPVGKGSVILNSTVDVQCAETYYGRTPWKTGRYNNAAIVNTTFKTSGSGELITDFYGDSCADNIDDKYVGWKTYGNTLPTGQTDTTTKHVALDEAFYKKEYSGRRTILNRVYKGGEFEQDASGKWDVDALISKQGWKVDGDTSSDLASGETKVNSVVYTFSGTSLNGPVTVTSSTGDTSGITLPSDFVWHDTQHGTYFNASDKTITLTLTEPSVITLKACSQNNSGTIATTGVTQKTFKGASDGESQSILYTGNGGTLTISFTGTVYLHDQIVVKTLTNEVNKVASVSIGGSASVSTGGKGTLTASCATTYLNDYTPESYSWSCTSGATVSGDGASATITGGSSDATVTVTCAVDGVSGKKVVTVGDVTAEAGKTYSYNLESAEFKEKTGTSTDGLLSWTATETQNHGIQFGSGNTMTIVVAGSVNVALTCCQYANQGKVNVTDSDGNAVVSDVSVSNKTADGGDGTCTTAKTISYTGGKATKLTFTFTNTAYIHAVTVTPAN